MTITWRLEPTSNGTLMAAIADDVSSVSAAPRNGSGIAPPLANLANFVE